MTTMPKITAPMTATVQLIAAAPGQALRAGELLLVLEAMKMEHEITAPFDGVVEEIFFAAGEPVQQGETLLSMRPASVSAAVAETKKDEAGERADLRAWRERRARTLDAARPDAA